MKESQYLHVGDPVWWQGDWGNEEPRIAEVEEIEYNCVPFDNRGIQAERLPWRKVRSLQWEQSQDDNELIPVIVTLTNGHWAYGWQITALAIWAKTYEEDMQVAKEGAAVQVDNQKEHV